MRVKNMLRKKESLDCLFQEINILTECRHPNIVKILDASFDGSLEHRRFTNKAVMHDEVDLSVGNAEEKTFNATGSRSDQIKAVLF